MPDLKGDQDNPNNYRGITLLNVVGKLFHKVLNYRLLYWLEEHKKLSESQAGFRFCFGKLWRVIRNIYNVNQSCVNLDGIKSEYFGITQGVA